MAKMYLAFVFNLFQPTTQNSQVVQNVTRECYLPLAKLCNSNSSLKPKFTLSVTSSLLRLLEKEKIDQEFKELLIKAQRDEKVEIIHSGAYYPIFPLIPPSEVERQIKLDIEYKERVLEVTKSTGIFSPELCYDDKLLSLYKNFDFQWTLIDDQLMVANDIAIPSQEIYQVEGVQVFMRSSFWSNNIPKERTTVGRHWTGEAFIREMKQEAERAEKPCYKIIALGGETFGHHIKYYQETFLRDMLYNLQNDDTVELCLVSDLADKFPLIDKSKALDKSFVYFPPSSWATSVENANRGDLYVHWKSQGNAVHEKLWALTDLLFEACQNLNFQDKKFDGLRKLLDQAFYSETYFFASIHYWRSDLIYKGIDLQMRILYKYYHLTNNERVFKQGTEIYVQLMREIVKERLRKGEMK